MGDFSLFVTHPDGHQTEHLITDGLRVGRLRESEVRVASPYLSRIHFIVERDGDGWAVVSQHQLTAQRSGVGAVLGTYVNGERVAGRRRLHPGDRLCPKPEPAPEIPVFVFDRSVHPLAVQATPPTAVSSRAPLFVALGCVLVGGLATVGAAGLYLIVLFLA